MLTRLIFVFCGLALQISAIAQEAKPEAWIGTAEEKD
jgi:hypothetical protein